MAARPRASAWPRPGNSGLPWNGREPNGSRARYSGVTRSRPASTSSSCRAGKCSMHPSPALKPTTWLPSSGGTANVPGRPRGAGIPAAAVLGLLRAYKVLISPLFTGCCRFQPSCSDYMREAVLSHGALRGTWYGLRRLARCRPFGGHGYDPCPPGPLTRQEQPGQ